MERALRQIVYFSTAAAQQDAASIARIAAPSLKLNMRDDITGLLVAGGHRFLQVIEGESRLAETTLSRIRRDRRHVGVTVLVDRPIARRTFPVWTVSFSGEPEFGDFATLAEMLDMLRARVKDREARNQIDCFARQFVLNPPAPPASPWTLASDYRERSALDRRHQ